MIKNQCITYHDTEIIYSSDPWSWIRVLLCRR